MPLFFPPRAQYEDVNGAVLVGAKLWFYVTGTSTPKDTYTTSALSTANTNPVVADANGIFPDIYLATDADYKVILTTSAGVAGSPAIWTVDPYFSDIGTGRTPVADINYPATINDRLIAYTSLTASRTVTLPSALTFPAGTRLVIVDESGSASSSKVISVAPNGTDTINGSNTTQVGINTAYGRAELESNGGTGWFWMARTWSPVTPGAIDGLTYANGTDATNDIDIAAGYAADATNTYLLTLGAALTKQSDAAWAVGSGQGGLDNIASAGNNEFYIWLIARPDTGVVDALFSLSATAPTMPANYTLKVLFGWFKRSGGAILPLSTHETAGGGLDFSFTTPIRDVNLANTLTTSRRTDALSVPKDFSVEAQVRVATVDAAPSRTLVGNPSETDAAPAAVDTPMANINNLVVGVSAPWELRIRTSATGTIYARADVATIDTYVVVTVGFRWSRR